MPIHLLGATSPGEAPFNRAFFNTTLGDILGREGKTGSRRVTLFLIDGTTLDVCSIENLAEAYATVMVYQGRSDARSTNLHLLPYGIIYRVEIAPSEGDDPTRLGFHWGTARDKGTS